MKHETPAGPNPIDQGKVIGKPTPRPEGPLKVSGKATYAYEWHSATPRAAYGWLIGAAIGMGRIRSILLDEAKAAPGVLAVVTAQNAGPLSKGPGPVNQLAGPDVAYYHQTVAMVVAESLEQARAAAALVRINYDRAEGRFDLTATKDKAFKPERIIGGPVDTDLGDFNGAFAAAPVTLDATYTTPDMAHAMMEPHATLAEWKGDQLTVWTSTQMVTLTRISLSQMLGIKPDNVHVISPYCGGGFGGKLTVRSDCLMAAVGARITGRPVKVVLQRPLMFNNTHHRAATIQRFRIGATSDGRITAIGHESWSGDLEGGRSEPTVRHTRAAYAGANRMTRTRQTVVDLPEAGAMRAPGDVTGSMTLEVAMDEMAEKLGIDPVRFRILNDSQTDPERPGKPYSQRQLVECLNIGAEKFGWSKRATKPGAARDGRWLIGLGVGCGVRGSRLVQSAAQVRLEPSGRITVETDMTDPGTGSYVIIAQTAAEMMGVPIGQVDVRLGDSTFPQACGSGGQFGANSSTSGVYAACVKLREAVATKLGMDPATAQFAGGKVSAGGKSAKLASAARGGALSGRDMIENDVMNAKTDTSAFAAHFVEVGVDADTAEIRIRRMLAVCSAGRILNPMSARSQVIGSMTMGAGAALTEDLKVDTRFGLFLNHDLAHYEVPVHADIPDQEVIFINDPDPASSPMKAKGVGEIGICGVSAAIANAVYNATGVRVRNYPIQLDALLMSKTGAFA